ncbi:MAG: prepilin-type N-terminal cleavage/methylation domain-containing protein [Phycisphaerae bacterium]|nr:prepilin-type N-terminal cleavage/methylation domain-containing protein [Phycisphaerae bacterium]
MRRVEPSNDPRMQSQIIAPPSSIILWKGLTLVELLVVIGVIAVLLAILIPVMSVAKEQAQRAICLSNLRQLTTAWTAYADDHDGRLVYGVAGSKNLALLGSHVVAPKRLEGWLGGAFMYPENRSALFENTDKGPLWPYLRDIDIYRCPRGWKDHYATYTTVAAANGVYVEGTYQGETKTSSEMLGFGARIAGTVLRLTRLTDISRPADRAVFLDQGVTPGSNDFYVHYLVPQWYGGNPPPIHHADGTTLSMADGHAEYWKWKAEETAADLPRKLVTVHSALREMLDGGSYEPKTEDGLWDLQRLQRTTWGRLRYTVEESP